MTNKDFDPSQLDVNGEKTASSQTQGDILGTLEEQKKNEIDLETLSTFLTDQDIRPEEIKKIDEEKKQNVVHSSQNENIYDININSLDDILNILQEHQYDFVVIEPHQESVKVSFKKEQIVKESRNIKFHIYSKLLLEAKKISHLKLEDITNEQKGVGEYRFKDRSLEILSRTVPGNFGESLYLKYRDAQKKVEKKATVKKPISPATAFGFLGAMLFIALVVGGAFITFVVFNAQTPSDVSFFQNLGINLNDVNSFLLKVTTFVFSIVVLVETILLIIALFKALLTKKEFKRKKTLFSILSGVLLIFSFSTGSLWMSLDKAIKNLPNWQEMSYGNIQIFDNDLLKSSEFDKSNALIKNYASLIGPVELKFDLNYLQKDELRRGFEIKKYIWDFGNGENIETQSPEIIQNFVKKGNYKINLTLEGIDARFPNKMTQKPASDMPTISISHLVKISYDTLENGGKTVSFDASDLKSLGDIEWYMKDDLTKAAYEGDYFQPSKIFFQEDAIGMRIKRKGDESNYMDRVFIVSGEQTQINGDIKYEASIDNDLEYTLKVEKLENTSGAGFIKSFKWIFEDDEQIKNADILRLEESSEVTHTFTSYGKQVVKVVVTNTAGKSTEIKKEINIPKRLKTTNQIDFYENGSKRDDVKYDDKTREYSLFDIGVPTRLKFDTRYIRADNPLYFLEGVTWDVGSDGSIEGKEREFEQNFDLEGSKEITVNYKFVHRRDKNEVITIKDKITLDFVQKDAIVAFDIKSDSEYVPALVSFDASTSKAKNDNIVKFIYDYGDGVTEERDAINPGHRYLKEGNYTVKLTIVTQNGKEYSASKTLILKSPIAEGKISVSMKSAPIGQEIDFLSTGSLGQIVGYHWDFGDGNTSTEANPSYAYKKAGKYKVVLTLEYANNNIITKEIEVEITE